MLNRINYGIELNDQRQENLDFSREYKENLEFYLKQDLINYLSPNNMNDNGRYSADDSDMNFVNISMSGNFNQSFVSQ